MEAGSILVMMFNPIWLIKTRLALQGSNASAEGSSKNVRYRGMLHAGSTIVKEEGVKGLYKGLVPALLLTSHGAVQFAVYEYLKKTCRDIWEDQVRKKSTFILRGLYLYIVLISVSVKWCIGKSSSSYLLLSRPIIALASHITIILTFALQSPSLLYQSMARCQRM